MTPHPPEAGQRPGERWILFAPALLSLAPFIAFHGLFARLFWFGDDIDQVDLIDRHGLWRWMWMFYGENLVPLFKLLWGSCVFLFGGSYDAMIGIIWLNHALNVLLLGRLMRTCGFKWTPVLLTQTVFGLAPSIIENLAFSVEWSVVLSVTFMLLALQEVFRPAFRWVTVLWALASALSFVKGVLTGPALAFASLLQRGGAPRRGARLAHACAYLLPSIVVGTLIAVLAEGNHRHLSGHGSEAAVFGVWYYCLNPVYYLLDVQSWGWRTVVVLGLLKVSLVIWAFLRSRGNVRNLFLVLVAFDLATAVLLGIGRYNFGIRTAASSRYQYVSLIGIVPLAAFGFAHLWERLRLPAWVRQGSLASLFAATILALMVRWHSEMVSWSGWRGTDVRRILLEEAEPGPDSVPGYPGFPTKRAKELIAKYHLH